jgi:hypothetical protein
VATPAVEPLGAPSLTIGAFQLRVHRRQFPDAEDRWDGNWLVVTAEHVQADATVIVTGPILDAVGLERFRDELAVVHHTRAGEATLASPEPNLHVRVGPPDRRGRLRLRVEITPDPAVQGHWFETEIDQSQLPPAILQLERVLERFPVRGLPVAIRDDL